jgi:hypothetical protein
MAPVLKAGLVDRRPPAFSAGTKANRVGGAKSSEAFDLDFNSVASVRVATSTSAASFNSGF